MSKGIIVIITNYSSGLSSSAIELGRCTVAELSPDQIGLYKICQLDTTLPPGGGSGVGPTFTSSIIMSQNPGNGKAIARKVAEAPHKKKKKKK
jgi:hypothetical protein